MFLKWFLISYLGVKYPRWKTAPWSAVVIGIGLEALAVWGVSSSIEAVRVPAAVIAWLIGALLAYVLLVGPLVCYLAPDLRRRKWAESVQHNTMMCAFFDFTDAFNKGKNPRHQAERLLEEVGCYWVFASGGGRTHLVFGEINTDLGYWVQDKDLGPALEVDDPYNPTTLTLTWNLKGRGIQTVFTHLL